MVVRSVPLVRKGQRVPRVLVAQPATSAHKGCKVLREPEGMSGRKDRGEIRD
jgi:hypothetical protein